MPPWVGRQRRSEPEVGEGLDWQRRVKSQGCTGKEALPAGAVGGTQSETSPESAAGSKAVRQLGRGQRQN